MDNDNSSEKSTEVSDKPVVATAVTPPRSKKITTIIVIAAIVAGIVLVFYALKMEMNQSGDGTLTQRETTKNDGNKVVTQEEEDIASVVSKVSPSVVSILTKSTTAGNSFYGSTEALFAKDNGLYLIKKLIEQTSPKLRSGGYLLLEADLRQHADMIRFAKTHGLAKQDIKGLIVSFQKD